jgi:hypothetical protein
VPEINRPADVATLLADYDRRLRTLETSARILATNTVIPTLAPTNSAQVATQAAVRNPVAYDSVLRSTSAGAIAMPAATAIGSVFLVAWEWKSKGYGTAGGTGYLAERLELALYFDGVWGGLRWFWRSTSVLQNTPESNYLIGIWAPGAGVHTVETYWAATPSASSPNPAELSDQTLAVVPLKLD